MVIDTTKKITGVSSNGVNFQFSAEIDSNIQAENIKKDVTILGVTGTLEGGGGEYQRPSDWLTIPTLDTTKDEIYILNGVTVDGINMIFLKIRGSGTIDWGDGSTPETFSTGSSIATYSHHYNYSDINSNTWTEHNMSRQVLVHISGNRQAFNYFSLAVQYSYTNADGVTVNYSNSCSNDIYEIKANVNWCEVQCNDGNYYYNKKLEIFDWSGSIMLKSSMFSYCYSLQSIPQLNTTGVSGQQLSCCFNRCYSLKTVPLFDITATDVKEMFQYCYSLQSVPKFDLSRVTTMTRMFSYCKSLQNVPQFDTHSAQDINQMFQYCDTLQSIPQFDTRNARDMSQIFNQCFSLKDVPQLDMSSVSDASNMFAQCPMLQKVQLFNFNPTRTSALTLSNLTPSTTLTKQALVDLFNSLATNTGGYSRTIQIGSTLQGYLANCYVKDSGDYYTAIMPTQDTSIQSGKTYYTYDNNTDTYTQVTPDFSSGTFYYELRTATWNKYVICESTDTGAMLALDFARNIKGYTIS